VSARSAKKPPWEIRREVRAALGKARNAMLSPEWDAALDGATDAQKLKAARTLLRVQSAYLRVGNAELEDIRDALVSHGEALLAGKKQLEKTLRSLGQVRQVLETTAQFVALVARVVALAA
jgi:hypothetical protein